MTNLAVENGLKKLHIPFARANVGDRYVLELLQKKAGSWAAKDRAILFVRISIQLAMALFRRFRFCTRCATPPVPWPSLRGM